MVLFCSLEFEILNYYTNFKKQLCHFLESNILAMFTVKLFVCGLRIVGLTGKESNRQTIAWKYNYVCAW